ncbi:MAG: hypothetical protein QW596_02335 [Sulfolobales archaeon]
MICLGVNAMAVPFCEVYARTLLPALKAMIAKELVNVYGLTQWSVTKTLGMTQPLINYYLSGRRGSKFLDILSRSEEIRSYVKNAAALIAKGEVDSGLIFCSLCISLRSNKDLLKDLGISKVHFHPKCSTQ